ncbi:MAG: substrate-binding domain-containing protein [Kiritimatiellales bacterium]|jgi:LacI family transcriptional regulator
MAVANRKLRIGVVLNLVSPSLSQLVGGVIDYRRKKNRNWRIETANVESLRDPSALVPSFDGAVVTPPLNVVMNQSRFPFVLIQGDTPFQNLNVPTVEISHAALIEMAVRYLRLKGFKRIGLVSYPHSAGVGWINRREEVFLEQCRHRKIEASVFSPSPETEGNYTQLHLEMKDWLKGFQFPAAILAINDLRALDVQTCCWQNGLLIPEDIALMGIDNNPAVCPFMNPPLTSIELNYRSIGWHAAAVLDSLLTGGTTKPSILKFRDFTLLERASTDILVPKNELVEKALQYISDHCNKPIQAADVFSALKTSHTTLARHFKNETGATVHDSILQIRLSRAKELLADPDMRLKEIAGDCGFSNPQYFSTVFKKQEGVTPAQYRVYLQADLDSMH